MGESISKCGIPGVQLLVFHSHWLFDSDGTPRRSYGYLEEKKLTKTEQKNNLQFACQWIFVPCSSGCSVQSWFSRICEAMLVLTYTRTLGKQHSGAGTEGFLVLRVAGSGCLSLPIHRLHACFPAKLC